MAEVTQSKKPVQNRKTSKKRPFLRFIKRLFVFIFIIILLVAAAFTVAYFVVDPQVLVTRASEVLKEKYNREIEVSSIKLSIIKGITLEGIDLSYRGGFSTGSALSLKEATILYNPVALLLGELDIIKIRIAGFHTSYNNIMSITRDFTKDSKKKEPESETTAKKGPGLFRIKMRLIEIDDAQFEYNNIFLDMKMTVIPKADFNQSVIKAHIYSPYGKINLDGTLDKLNIVITDLQADKFSSGINNVRVNKVLLTLIKENENRYTLVGKNVDVDAMGYHITTFTRFEGSYGIKGQSVLLYNFGVKVNQASMYLHRLSYFVRNQYFSATVTNISANISDFVPGYKGNITGKLDIEKRKNLYISGDLLIDNFKYKFIRDGQLRLKLKNNSLKGTVNIDTSGGKMFLSARSDNVVKSPTVFTLDSKKLDLYPIMLNFQSGKGATKTDSSSSNNTKAKASPAMDIPPMIFKAKIQALSFKEYTLENVRLTAAFQRGGIEINNFSLEFIGGILRGSGSLNGNYFDGSVSYKDGNLRKFSAKYLKDGKKLYGRINAASRFRLNIVDPLASSMKFDLDMTGGEIINFVLLEKINKLLYFIPADNIQYDRIQTSLELKKGDLKIKNMDFLSDDLTMTTRGVVDLKRKTQDINLVISIHERYLEKGAFVLKAGLLSSKDGDYYRNTVHITGAFDKPVVKLNPK